MREPGNNNIIKLLLGLVLFSFISLAFVYAEPANSDNKQDITPTLFIHGYKGGPRSFQTMLQRFERNHWGEKAMVIRVNSNGNITMSGQLNHTNHPFIQLIFQENRASIEQQTEWMETVLTRLKTVYEIKQVNLVGHSMGGLTATNVILQNNRNTKLPAVNRLVVIGSPFKGIDQANYFLVNTGAAAVDLKTQSEALTNMIKHKAYFDPSIRVLAIAGVINDTGTDGLVSSISAMGIEDIVGEQQMEREIFYDKNATHSGLHEHPGVDQKIASFLWN